MSAQIVEKSLCWKMVRKSLIYVALLEGLKLSKKKSITVVLNYGKVHAFHRYLGTVIHPDKREIAMWVK